MGIFNNTTNTSGSTTVTAGIASSALGFNNFALGNGSSAVGGSNYATGTNSAALGTGSFASGLRGVAIGYGQNNTAPTADLGAQGTDAIAIGTSSYATNTSSMALGTSASSTAAYGIAIGDTSSVSLANSVAIGRNSTATALNAGAYTINGGSIAATTSPGGVVSVGSVGNECQIQNVGAGVVSATSTDAVNGSQLYAVGSSVNNLESRLGQQQNQITNISQNIVNLYQNQESLSRKAYEGTAVSLAAAGGNFLQQNQKFAVTGKFGTFRSQNALGVVAQARVNDNLIAHAGVGGGLRMGRIGVSGGLTVEW